MTRRYNLRCINKFVLCKQSVCKVEEGEGTAVGKIYPPKDTFIHKCHQRSQTATALELILKRFVVCLTFCTINYKRANLASDLFHRYILRGSLNLSVLSTKHCNFWACAIFYYLHRIKNPFLRLKYRCKRTRGSRLYTEKEKKYKIIYLFTDFLDQHGIYSYHLIKTLALYKCFVAFMHKTIAYPRADCTIKT